MSSAHPNGFEEPQSQTALDGAVHVALTYKPLDVPSALARVKDPSAGAVVMFAGTTRSTFASKPVASLTYTAYPALALRTLLAIARTVHATHALVRIALVHRLGPVPVGDESVLVCVSAPHRTAAWRAGEQALEEVKARAEIWKLERFVGETGGVWKSNVDGAAGVWVPDEDVAAETSVDVA